mgnify:CR=1 FL=1
MKRVIDENLNGISLDGVESYGPGRTDAQRLLRLRTVLTMIPVGRSTWYQGVRSGRYPKQIRLSARAVAWDRGEILELMQRLATATS